MGDYPGIYRGTDYGFDPRNEPEAPLIPSKYRIQPGQFGITTDPRSANQLKEVADKLNTGAKTIELSGISTEVLESMPDPHLREIARLKKIAGADITFHGPLVEPTGFNQQGNWEEANRMQAERQIWDAIKRGQQLMIKNVTDSEKGLPTEYEDNNLVVTLHTSNGLINPIIKMKEKNKETGKMEENVKSIAVIDEYSGKAGYLPLEEDAFEGKDKPTAKDELKKINEKIWRSNLQNVSIEMRRGQEAINHALIGVDEEKVATTEIGEMRELFKKYVKNADEYHQQLQKLDDPVLQKQINNRISDMAHGANAVQDSYIQMKEWYNRAEEALKEEVKNNNPEAKEALERLQSYKKQAAPIIVKYKEDPTKVKEFSDQVAEGIRLLSTMKHVPPMYRPLEDFAVEKASETFANVATKAYEAFGEKAPILSLENPPVGMGLTRADEIEKLVKATRTKLQNNLQEQGLTETEAAAAAKKLIGVTWDVGHINMIKKYGYDDTDLVKETEKIKPYLKHVHLSDNFGMEHTELPMGMGNVPMKEHLAVIGDKMKNMKAIIETGGHWYQDFKVSPLAESFAAFGSPIYPMQMQPYWDKTQGRVGSYFAGYGMNPDVHHSIYGAGFSGLPVELGGQMQGGRNRLSGNPLE